MALPILDGNGAPKTLKTSLDGSDLVPHQKLDSLPGTVEPDIYASKSFLETIANAIPNLISKYWFSRLTDGTNNVAVKAASTAAVAADPALTVAVSPNNTVLTTIADLSASASFISSASFVTLGLQGRRGASFYIAAGFNGTLVADVNFTSANEWVPTVFWNHTTNAIESSIATGGSDSMRSIIVPAGAITVRVRATAFTSGSATLTLRASNAGAQQYNAQLAQIVANQTPPTAIYGNKTNVITAGTRVQLQAASQALTEGVWVRALDANTGLIYVGNITISATAGGTRLAAKEAVFIRIDNLNKVNIDAAVNGEGVTYLGW
jgi:hypothetical protein